jgi:S-DNA-T family DNA segregation ATPase FtsK/SpoIIIE
VGAVLKRELAGIALLLLAVFVAGSLLLQQAAPNDQSCLAGHGFFGPAGSCVKSFLVWIVGPIACWLLPVAAATRGIALLGRGGAASDRSWMVFLLGSALILPVGIGLARGGDPDAADQAGLWGSFVAHYVREGFGSAGAWIVFALAASALMAWTLRWNPIRALLGSARPRAAAGAGGPLVNRLEPAPEELPAIEQAALPLATAEPAGTASRRAERKPKSASRSGGVAADDKDIAIPVELGADALRDVVPPTDLLSHAPVSNVDVGLREIDAMGLKLMDALRTFRVDGELVGRTTGPVVTQFEIEPAPGVKVRQFANLANDLALAMRAQSIRVVAPIPGRGAVGVEVPNPTPQIVWFRELVEAREYQNARAALLLVLGKDLEGRPVMADLAKMPHLLIAGATGSGKSVCVNTIVTSLVYRHTPETLRFLMIDPKMVELSVYNRLPHLRYRVVTDNRDAASLLKWAVIEMHDRYHLMAANGVRNIQEFNKRLADGATLLTPRNADVAFEDRTYRGGRLPYLVIVIDELADLMMTVQGEVETPLALLAQKARAIGIHLILATQRPSVNVITGLIKANFPSRIAFRVASQVDSRTIIDGIGAEALLGNGDMLFIPPGKSEPQRIQGAFIPGEDTERLMTWYERRRDARRAALAAKGLTGDERPAVDADILEVVRKREAEAAAADEEGADVADGTRDDLFRRAAEVCVQHDLGSTSLLQRRLGIGYGRAARIIDQLHSAGVLGPPNGSKPREILVGLDELERICGPAASDAG